MSSLKGNILSGYLNQFISTVVWIVVVPLYVTKMGPESYALVGLFSIAQLCFNFLDFGLTPTVARESARYVSGNITFAEFLSKYRAIVLFFLLLGVLSFAILYVLAPVASAEWFKTKMLSEKEVALSLRLMSGAVILRWLTGSSRGLLTGFEKIQWLNYFNLSAGLLRFVGVLPLIYFISASPIAFFYYQLGVAFLELLFISVKTRPLVKNPDESPVHFGWSLRPLVSILAFTFMIAVTSAIWVGVTQLDKILVSGLVSLEEYGYFVMATTVAAGVSLLVTPVTSSIMPRMTTLQQMGKDSEVLAIYRQYTQLTSIFLSSVVLTLVFGEKYFLIGWTGSPEISEKIRTVMMLYVLGNAFFAMGYFPYFIQFAKGSLRMHLLGYCILLVAIMGSIYFGSSRYGLLGAGIAWLSCNAIYFFVWIAITHAVIIPGVHCRWLWKDILTIWLPVSFGGFLFSLLPSLDLSRIGSLFYVGILGSILLAIAIACSQIWRNKVRRALLSFRLKI